MENALRNSGVIHRLEDGRLCIVFNRQPLINEKGKMVLALVDDEYNVLTDESGEPRTLVKDVDVYIEMMATADMIGFVN